MTDLVRQPTTTAERADRAYELEQQVVVGCRTIRAAWLHLAAYLHEMNAERLYTVLGYETFNEWLGTPEISLSRSHAYALIGSYVEFVIERGIDHREIDSIEATKLAETLPALRRGEVQVEDAIADASTLSRSDLREKYRADGSGRLDAETERPICPNCGARMKAATS
jgi:hypothetical protein